MVNQGQILGRVGKIDIKSTNNGVKIANVNMVTSKKFVKNGEKTEKVTWHNVTFYSKLAEIAEKYVNVGDLLYVQGEMDNQKYTDANGQERSKFFIIGHELKLVPKAKPLPATAPKQANDAFQDDEIPW